MQMMHATVPGLHMINMCPCILMFLGSPVQNVTPRDRLSHNVSVLKYLIDSLCVKIVATLKNLALVNY